ncbi:hypothetical protein D3C71_1709400 [compost metagenome]
MSSSPLVRSASSALRPRAIPTKTPASRSDANEVFSPIAGRPIRGVMKKLPD